MKKILVVDDDPLFRYLLERASLNKPFEVVTCGSLKELETVGRPQDFDVIILDYFLDPFTESFLGTRVAELAGSTPCLLVSSNDRCLEQNVPWPSSIRKFVSKHVGARSVLENALALTLDRSAS